jgi:hypothetical protein
MLRMRGLRSKVLAIAVAVMAVAWLAPGAEATISYNLDWVFSGQQPSGLAPWGTISFTTGAADTVNVTMTASNLSATEFISFWGFNSTAAVSGLTVTYSDTDASATFSKCDSSCSAGTFKADGDGFYEIVGAFQTSAGAGRFTNGEILTFTITGTGLTETNFSPVSTGGTGPGNYNTAIHIQGIAGSTTCSAWAGNSDSTGKAGTGTGDACTSVAEPSILLFAGLGLAGLVGVSRRFLGRRMK